MSDMQKRILRLTIKRMIKGAGLLLTLLFASNESRADLDPCI